jgi:hypothetical protein
VGPVVQLGQVLLIVVLQHLGELSQVRDQRPVVAFVDRDHKRATLLTQVDELFDEPLRDRHRGGGTAVRAAPVDRPGERFRRGPALGLAERDRRQVGGVVRIQHPLNVRAVALAGGGHDSVVQRGAATDLEIAPVRIAMVQLPTPVGVQVQPVAVVRPAPRLGVVHARGPAALATST